MNVLQRCSTLNVGSGQVRGKKIFGKNPAVWRKMCGAYMVRCLSMPFGVNVPQQSDKDEHIYYTEVYQLDVTPYDK